jgi:hypothetical protein
MPPAGFETPVLASERPQIHALDRAATGIGNYQLLIMCEESLHKLYTILFDMLFPDDVPSLV